MLLSGKDKGKTGTVTEVVRSKNWVFVEGLNTVSKLISKWDVCEVLRLVSVIIILWWSSLLKG